MQMDTNKSMNALLGDAIRQRMWCWIRFSTLLCSEAGLALGLYAITTDPLRQLGAMTGLAGPGRGQPLPLSVAVVAIAAVIAWVALALLVTATVAAAPAVVRLRSSCRSQSLSRLAGPRWLQRAVLAACGLSLLSPAAADATPATAGCLDPHQSGSNSADARGPAATGLPGTASVASAGEASRPRLTGLAMPDLPNSGGQGATVLVVHPGDSLWEIARERLPALVSDAVISRHVHALYRANRDVIGTDPDLIYPGTRLVLPGGKP